MIRFGLGVTTLALGLLIPSAAFSENAAGVKTASPFNLKDQFSKEYAVKFPASKPTVLIFLSKDDSASNQAKKWKLALANNAIGKKSELLMIVPINTTFTPMQMFIRAHMKEEPPFLLDWGSKVAALYGYVAEKKTAKVILVGADGRVLATEDGAYTELAGKELVAAFDGALTLK